MPLQRIQDGNRPASQQLSAGACEIDQGRHVAFSCALRRDKLDGSGCAWEERSRWVAFSCAPRRDGWKFEAGSLKFERNETQASCSCSTIRLWLFKLQTSNFELPTCSVQLCAPPRRARRKRVRGRWDASLMGCGRTGQRLAHQTCCEAWAPGPASRCSC